MHLIDIIQATASLLQAFIELASRLASAKATLVHVAEAFRQPTAYENLFIDLEVDIRDRQGMKAIVAKRQRVEFRSPLGGPIRDLVWGDGNALARYSTRGVRRLATEPEGSRKAVLLGLFHQPNRGERTTFESRRLIQSGFRQPDEYFDTFVERPTKRVSLRILFPRSRPPAEAHLVAEGRALASRAIPVRYAEDGRAFLAWRTKSPERFRIYSLRWRW